MKNIILSLILVSWTLKILGQINTYLIPEPIYLQEGQCQSQDSIVSKLLTIAKELDAQTLSEFHEDKVITIDLNDDGSCEYILNYYDGGANIVENIYEIRDRELKLLSGFWEGTYSWIEKYNEYPQILLRYYDGHKTNPIWKFGVLRFNGDKYERFYFPDQNYGLLRDTGLREYNRMNYELAEIHFRNVLRVYPHDDPTDVNNLALTLIKLNKKMEAKKLLLEEVRRHDFADSYFNLSLIYRSENNKEEELKCLIKSNELKPTNNKSKRIKELKEVNGR
jgi:tetratricopeptide (TPR) repeat protein